MASVFPVSWHSREVQERSRRAPLTSAVASGLGIQDDPVDFGSSRVLREDPSVWLTDGCQDLPSRAGLCAR